MARDDVRAERDDHEEQARESGGAGAHDKVEIVPGLELLREVVDQHAGQSTAPPG